ncbi:2Fe-2S iron-sulfur cluster-binding protein [Cognatishimia activa]|uniref:2Fe-2S iron-sulfur cluster-binding protein n=1 Tax=Cognatishimia activa TaxID=1715691 RepID=UPI002231649D|nr:2Fe-2S iron-sulfur cluster-binding protein [Cognatishimia activa]UZD89733.1 2Fe-2S iron-sulfur cluster-binding protein [Cognatishimia activa]
MVKVTFFSFEGQARTVDIPVGSSVMEGARDNNIAGIEADCGGACACSTCHVYVDDAWVDKLVTKGDVEEDMLEFAYEPNERLSRLTCQLKVTVDMEGLVLRLPERQV